jgi:uncharacterized protein YcfL
MKKLLLLAALALAGCNEHPATPETVVQQVYCVTPEQYAELVKARPESVKDQYTGQAQKDFQVSTEQSILLRIYSDGLLKVIGGCIGPAPSDA